MSWGLLCLCVVVAAVAAQPLDVVIVAHSHCDAGYRETFLGYFRDKVNLTLTSVVSLLAKDPTKRFVWEEVSYFQLWWDAQPQEIRDTVLRLTKTGQLEFIGGGWVMHDEADGTVAQQINQMSRGLQWLDENLGVRPHIQWQIDPFGHSSTTGVIHALMGFDAIILNRMDANIKQQWKKEKSLEFFWQPTSLQNSSEIFVHFLDSHYGSPPIPQGDVKSRATWLAQAARARAEWFLAPVLLLPVGGDFEFTDAPTQFALWDPLLEYITNNSRVSGSIFENMTVRYGTLNDYFITLKNVSSMNEGGNNSINFPIKKDLDFFPYIACNCNDTACNNQYGNVPCGSPDAFWTGFYTSKPAQKLLTTKQDASLRTTEMLYAIRRMANTIKPDPLPLSENWWSTLEDARFQSALYQHHDAITGTSFDHCTVSVTECDCYDDYTLRMNHAIRASDIMISQLAQFILSKDPSPPTSLPALDTNDNDNFLQLINKNASLVVVIINNLAWERNSNELISFGPFFGPIEQPELQITRASSSRGNEIEMLRAREQKKGDTAQIGYQYVYDPIRNITTLYFETGGVLSPLSLTTFFIEPKIKKGEGAEKVRPRVEKEPKKSVSDVMFSNGVVGLSFENSRVSAFLDSSVSITMSQDYLRYYERLAEDVNIFTGTNVYDFTPKGLPVSLFSSSSSVSTPPPLISVASGPLVWEIAQHVNEYVSHSYRLYKNSSFLLNQIRMGVLPQDISSSLSLKFLPAINNKGKFFTDTNSYSRMTRMENASRPVQGNMYPTSGKLSVIDEEQGHSFHLLTSRSVGVTSLNGSLEVLLHRRILDARDSRGNDSAIIDEPIMLMLQKGEDAHSIPTAESLKLANPLTLRSAVISSVEEWRAAFEDEISAMPASLPSDVYLLDLKALSNATQCPNGMRLWRINGESGDPAVSVPLQSVFTTDLQLLREFSVDYQIPIEHLPRKTAITKAGSVDTAVLEARGSIEAFVFNFFI